MPRQQSVPLTSTQAVNSASRFVVSFAEADHHLVHVDLWLRTQGASAIELVFPVWTPGSYMIREYARHVETISASAHDEAYAADSAATDRTLPIEHLDKHRWLVHCIDHAGVEAQWTCIRYRLYAREMSVRTNWVEHDFGFLTGAAAFPMVRGREQRPVMLRLELPEQWSCVATPLVRKSGAHPGQVELWADNYDCLVDSPIVCGKLDVTPFEVGQREHYLVNVNADDLWDNLRAVADVERIVAEHQRFWGDIPYERYYFLNLVTENGGGLEHDNACVLMASRWAMRRRDSYLNWLALVSHEFFHTWNVRRLRPRELMQYDYEREQYVRELWIAEGVTSYFDDLALVRSGLCTREEYLQRLSKNINTVQTAPGRLVQSLEESSWDTWIKHYRPDENSQNSRISYYLKGLLVAWLLDVQIQRASQGQYNLDEVMRCLWREHLHSGYTLDDFNQIVARLAGQPLAQWLEATITGHDELEYEPALEWFGLRFKLLTKDSADKTGDVWIGSESSASDGRVWVRRVLRGSPADRAGVNVDDELLALDGYRIEPSSWPDRLGMYQVGDELRLTVARRGKLLELPICLGAKPSHTWQLEISPTASSTAQQNLRLWLTS